jgi:hypothetical protein
VNTRATNLRPLAFGEVLDVAIKICVRQWRVVVPITLVLYTPLGLASGLLTIATRPATTSTDPFGQVGGAPPSTGTVVALVGGAVLAVAIVWLGTLIIQGALFRAIADSYLGGDPTISSSLRFGVARFRTILWVSIVTGTVVLLGAVACVIPGIWLGVATSLGVPVALLERTGGWKAVKRSMALVKDAWWRVFGLVIVAGLLGGIVQGIVAGLGATVIQGHGDLAELVGSTVLNSLGAAVSTPFAAAVSIVIYIDQRVRREGFDLQLLAAAIDGEVGMDTAAIVPTGPAPGPQSFPTDGEQPPYWPPPPGWKPSGE